MEDLKNKGRGPMWVLGDYSGRWKVLATGKYKCKKAKVYNVDMISGIFVQGNNRCTICVVCVRVCARACVCMCVCVI